MHFVFCPAARKVGRSKLVGVDRVGPEVSRYVPFRYFAETRHISARHRENSKAIFCAASPSRLLLTSPCSRSTMLRVVPAGALGVRSDGTVVYPTEVVIAGDSAVGGSGALGRRQPTTRRGREEYAQSRREERLRLLRETSFDYKYGRVKSCRSYCFSTTYGKVPAREHWEAFVQSTPIVNFAFRHNRGSRLVYGYFRLEYNIPVSSVPKKIASGLGIDSYVCGLTVYPLPDPGIGLSKYTRIAVDEPELAEWIYASDPPPLSGQR
jgi:hypothetical protein